MLTDERVHELLESPERNALLDQIDRAHTLDQLEAAEAAIAIWLDRNSDDIGIRDSAEMLFLARQSITARANSAAPLDPEHRAAEEVRRLVRSQIETVAMGELRHGRSSWRVLRHSGRTAVFLITSALGEAAHSLYRAFQATRTGRVP